MNYRTLFVISAMFFSIDIFRMLQDYRHYTPSEMPFYMGGVLAAWIASTFRAQEKRIEVLERRLAVNGSEFSN